MREGEVLGRYSLIAPIAPNSGIWSAQDVGRSRRVGIRRLPAGVDGDLRRISHPNIVKFEGVVESNGVRYCVTEPLSGRTVADIIAAGGGVTALQVLEYAEQMGQALSAAYREGVKGCDLEPEYVVIVQPSSSIKIFCFPGARPDALELIARILSLVPEIHETPELRRELREAVRWCREESLPEPALLTEEVDSFLISLAQMGVERAFRSLWSQHFVTLKTFVRVATRRIPRHLKEEYVNEIYTILARRIQRYDRTKGSLLEYWCATIRDEQLAFLRSQGLLPPVKPLHPGEQTATAGGPRIDERLAEKDLLEKTLRELFRLPTAPHHLIVFALVEILELKPGRIGSLEDEASSDYWRCSLNGLLEIVSACSQAGYGQEVRIGNFVGPVSDKLRQPLGQLLTGRAKRTYAGLADRVAGTLTLEELYDAAVAGWAPQGERPTPPTPEEMLYRWRDYAVTAIGNHLGSLQEQAYPGSVDA